MLDILFLNQKDENRRLEMKNRSTVNDGIKTEITFRSALAISIQSDGK